MAKFDSAISLILKHEGGYVNNPNDPGGATNYGISLRFLRDYPTLGDVDDDGDVDVQDIKQLTKEQASAIYKQVWWDKYQYEQYPDVTIATKVFDFAINMGAVRAHKLLQQALNKTYGLRLTTDGIIGPATMSIIRAIKDGADEQKFIDAYSAEAYAFYQSLVQNNPKLGVFLKGWKNRAFSIAKANSVL